MQQENSRMLADKHLERERYDERGRRFFSSNTTILLGGAGSIAPVIRKPYLIYETAITNNVRSSHKVLELGAGMGEHTGALLATGAAVTCLDIAKSALEVLQARFKTFKNSPTVKVGDIENVPFPDQSFDVIACAGVLSYGESGKVDREINRLLRPGGILLCVDSLNHNPIYRLNRWIHYLRGHRSRSTLMNMPTLQRIENLTAQFRKTNVEFLGSFTWVALPLSRILGQKIAALFVDKLDILLDTKRSAFKFVLVASGYRNGE